MCDIKRERERTIDRVMEWKKRGEECPGQQHARSPFLPCAAPFAVAVAVGGWW